jgi:hypothetical protein
MASTITQTTLSGGPYGAEAGVISVVSASNISAPVANVRQKLYVINPDTSRGELMDVVGVSGTQISVSRLDMNKSKLIGPTGNGGVGATVLIGPTPDATAGAYLGSFYEFDPIGSSANNMNSGANTPWVNVSNGNQWLYSSVLGLWVPGWNNPTAVKGLTAAVASAAGLITPSGPLFHVTGTSAITGFTVPTGFAGGSFTIIPDAIFTWTSANNIALAGTAVVSKALTFQYDSNTGKFYPSYIA